MALKISGTILAGGAGKRFNGILKPGIVIDGETIISRTLAVIKDLFDEIIIVTANPEEFKAFGYCTIIPDEIPDAGPLGGIHAALKKARNEALFVFAGDMPFLSRDIIIRMTDVFSSSESDALIPAIDENIEPLHSIYRTSLTASLEEFLKNVQNRAVRDFLKIINVQYMNFESSETNRKAFTNINSPSDISSS